jgi:beta-glucosidase
MMKKNLALTIGGMLLFMITGSMIPAKAQKVPQLGKASVKEVVAAMTIEEKARLLVGTGMFFEIPDSIAKKMGGFNPFGPKPGADTTYNAMISKVQKLVPGSAGATAELSRLGIPPTVVADGPAGVRISPTRKGSAGTFYCTAFPVGTLLASTWDKDLVRKVGEAYGNEDLEYGVDVALGPGMNIQRNPLCGRNFEYYSEDPLVAGKMAAAMVNGIQSQGVGTSIKHFAANNQETNRNSVNVVVSERALREIYLEGFRIAVQEAQPWTVMSSYNKINGTYTSERADLLTDVLRKDWGFKGYVMTDWMGGSDAVAQVNAGNDLLMPGSGDQWKKIVDAVKAGKLDVKVLDRNVEKILNIVLQSPRFKGYKNSNQPDLKAHAAIARMAATEGMVLLKNENSALPLAAGTKKIAAFGNGSYEVVIGGTGSGDVNEAYTISPAEGYKNAGYSIDESLKATYLDYIKIAKANRPKGGNFFAQMMGANEPVAEMDVTAEMAVKMAKTCDVAVITIYRNAGEGQDRKVDNDFNFSATEKSLIKTVTAAFHAIDKKVIVVLNIGGVVETASWRSMPDAILLAWQPGQEAGNAIADILSGTVSPSGKLAVTFPISYEDVPSAKNFPGIDLPLEPGQKHEPGMMGMFAPKPSKVVYEDGIFVGYRYYNTFDVKTAYDFGYGLSYTNFTYSNLKLSTTTFKDKLMVTVDVKNTGKVAGKDVVQLYLSAPAVKMYKPESELKGFEKTKLLQPGESQILTFAIDRRNLASFDTPTSSWIAEAGIYTVKIGASCTDIKLTSTFNLAKELMVKQETRALAPAEAINELKPVN